MGLDINTEQKVRLSFSRHACDIIQEDMLMFNNENWTNFLNTIFMNFKNVAHSSISDYLKHKENAYYSIFSKTSYSSRELKDIVDVLLLEEIKTACNLRDSLMSKDSYQSRSSRTYRLNNENYKFITEDCSEEKYYKNASDYITCVIEEYCQLPFIKRERIYLKDLYENIEFACNERRILKIQVLETQEIFDVYPYAIIPDTMQSYLAAFSKRINSNESKRMFVSFKMYGIKILNNRLGKYTLSKEMRRIINSKITQTPPAYLTSSAEEIHIRLSERGQSIFRKKLYARPSVFSKKNNELVVYCTQHQALNYFSSFFEDVEIISPPKLRERFINHLSKALDNYSIL